METAMLAFWKDRLGEEERAAKAVDPEAWVLEDGWIELDAALADLAQDRSHPATILAEIESKRRVIEWLEAAWGSTSFGPMSEVAQMLALNVLAAMVQPYDSHPDFHEEWKLK